MLKHDLSLLFPDSNYNLHSGLEVELSQYLLSTGEVRASISETQNHSVATAHALFITVGTQKSNLSADSQLTVLLMHNASDPIGHSHL